MKADFWDVVRVADACKHAEIRGKLGYINGIGEEEGNPLRSIAVSFYDLEGGWCVDEEDLIILGHKDEIARADYEKWSREAPHIRVSPDGRIVD
jgi:hypothetical protein